MAPLTTRGALATEKAQRVAALFGALGDPTRVRIISILVQGEANVSTLAEGVGLSVSAVSHHLRGLRQMRLVRFRKVGREVHYRLSDDHVAQLFHYGVEHASHR